MAKSICLDTVSQWGRDQIFRYPEMGLYIDKLISLIETHPRRGVPDPFLWNGRELPFRKHSVKLLLFPPQYAIGFNSITASYLFSGENILIVRMNYA